MDSPLSFPRALPTMSQSVLRRKTSKDPNSVVDKQAVASAHPLPPAEQSRNLFVRRGIVIKLLLGSGILAFFSWISMHSGNSMRCQTYVVCSSSGRQIYTVDEINSSVQCMIVHDGHIFDTGDLGMTFRHLTLFVINQLCPEDLRNRWSEAKHDGIRVSSRDKTWDKLDVKFLPESSIVVPGLTGTVFFFCPAYRL